MANKTECQTPGAIFHTEIKPKKVSISVDLPNDLNLDEKQAALLKTNLHNAMELVLHMRILSFDRTQ